VVTAAVPDGVVVEVPVRVTDHSPSQERLTRIAAMLRDAEQSVSVSHPGNRGRERGRREHRIRPAS
jgi:hypothetical protein